MNEQTKNATMYEALPVVAELNRVPTFDPLKFAQRVPAQDKQGTRLKLDLKYKKLWLRLKYPQARLKVTALKITEQIAIFEAKVFFDRKDTSPVASHIASCTKEDTPGGLYIERAEYEAKDQALDEAGFGIQLINVPQETETVTQPVLAAESESVPEITSVSETATSVAAETSPEVEKTAEIIQIHQAENPPVEQQIVAPAIDPEQESEPKVSVQAAITPQDVMIEDTAQHSAHEEETVSAQNQRFSAEMSVDDICSMMTLQEALDLVSDVGSCKGWTLEQVRDRRPASLKWYTTQYSGENNVLRAGAKLILDSMEMAAAS